MLRTRTIFYAFALLLCTCATEPQPIRTGDDLAWAKNAALVQSFKHSLAMVETLGWVGGITLIAGLALCAFGQFKLGSALFLTGLCMGVVSLGIINHYELVTAFGGYFVAIAFVCAMGFVGWSAWTTHQRKSAFATVVAAVPPGIKANLVSTLPKAQANMVAKIVKGSTT